MGRKGKSKKDEEEERGKERPLPIPSFPLFSPLSFPFLPILLFSVLYRRGKEERRERKGRPLSFQMKGYRFETREGHLEKGGPMSVRYLGQQKNNQPGVIGMRDPLFLT